MTRVRTYPELIAEYREALLAVVTAIELIRVEVSGEGSSDLTGEQIVNVINSAMRQARPYLEPLS